MFSLDSGNIPEPPQSPICSLVTSFLWAVGISHVQILEEQVINNSRTETLHGVRD